MSLTTHATSLYHGSNLISRWLTYCLCPMGLLYRHNLDHSNKHAQLPITAVLAVFSVILTVPILEFILENRFGSNASSSTIELIKRSTFVVRAYRAAQVYRFGMYLVVIINTIAQHAPMSNVLSTRNNIVSPKEQEGFAITCISVFLVKASSIIIVFVFVLARGNLIPEVRMLDTLVAGAILFILSLMMSAPLMYACYVGKSLGRHVENFSASYIDTMFDQFLESSRSDKEHCAVPRLHMVTKEKLTTRTTIRRGFRVILDRILELRMHLNSHKYPELPEMNMTKLSSMALTNVCESGRNANSQLIRLRLRKTQIMLSELRDTVNDVNKLASPIILGEVIFQTVMTVIVTTASIQSKIFRSINLLMLPTVVFTLNVVTTVMFVCMSLDDTTSQLKLMMNKLFDFIIMNHRVQTDDLMDMKRRSSRLVSPNSEKSDEAMSETWSQFQYTRKLASTIQFTMGGLLPVSRRLVLLILGHVLSAVFISIEIMSIVDTQSSKHPHHQGSTHVTGADFSSKS